MNGIYLTCHLRLLNSEVCLRDSAERSGESLFTLALPCQSVTLGGQATATDIGRNVDRLSEVDDCDIALLALSIDCEDELESNSKACHSFDLEYGDFEGGRVSEVDERSIRIDKLSVGEGNLRGRRGQT